MGKFILNDRVNIIPFDSIAGRIIAIFSSIEGTKYLVRYYYGGKVEEVYFYEDELIK